MWSEICNTFNVWEAISGITKDHCTYCGQCSMTDGLCYTSLPPKVRCLVTDEFHYYEDKCNLTHEQKKEVKARLKQKKQSKE